MHYFGEFLADLSISCGIFSYPYPYMGNQLLHKRIKCALFGIGGASGPTCDTPFSFPPFTGDFSPAFSPLKDFFLFVEKMEEIWVDFG